MIYTHKSLQLEHYVKEKISPVNYDISNIKKHFQIRGSLYRLLGLIPSFFKGKKILEVGPGSGQNSIYIASLFPKIYDLLEPNPYACKDISKIFKKFSHKHTKPNLFQKSLDDFKNDKLYDIVISEGWPGGFLDYDKSMLIKLSSFVKPGGILLITFCPPVGGVATYLRRLIGRRLIKEEDNLEHKTKILKKAFSNHLKKLSNMTRSQEHWIQDLMFNPSYYTIHNTPKICNKIFDDSFKFFHSVPGFSTEWRWYKSLHGKYRKINENFLYEYNKFSHCLIDYRIDAKKRSPEKNIKLEKLCSDFAIIANKKENLGYSEYTKNLEPIFSKIITNIENDLPLNTKKGLKEAYKILKKKVIKIEDVKNMSHFSSFFGREQCYLSLIKE
jgi:SAM-dependent methyltransferase